MILMAIACAATSVPQPTGATSCQPPNSPDAEFDQADAVFTGTAVRVPARPSRFSVYARETLRTVDGFLGTELAGLRSPVTFEVDASWKGVTTTRTVVHTYSGGLPFVEGHRYLIYAFRWEGDLNWGICSRTTAVQDATVDLAALAKRDRLALREPTPAYRLVGLAALALLGVWCLHSQLGRRRKPSQPFPADGI